MDYVRVFITGGILCAIAQILMEKTKMMPGRIMVLYVCCGAVLGAIGVYKPLVDWGMAGATVPLTGFGYVLWNGVKLAVNQQGFIGIFKGGLTAGALGIAASLIFSFLVSLVFKSRTKK